MMTGLRNLQILGQNCILNGIWTDIAFQKSLLLLNTASTSGLWNFPGTTVTIPKEDLKSILPDVVYIQGPKPYNHDTEEMTITVSSMASPLLSDSIDQKIKKRNLHMPHTELLPIVACLFWAMAMLPELLAVVYAFEKFRSYLVMSKSIVYTDHSAIKYLFARKDAKANGFPVVKALDSVIFNSRLHILSFNLGNSVSKSNRLTFIYLAIFINALDLRRTRQYLSMGDFGTDNQEKDEKQSQNDKTGLGMEKL
ncbi:reverse transcriptase domain-containing protein [Tanacetum coccineum]